MKMNLTDIESKIKYGNKVKARRRIIALISLIITTIILALTLMKLGKENYNIIDIIKVSFGKDIDGMVFSVREIRLPKMMSGLLAGFAFGISGAAFQTILRNPLANPNTLGITAGSSFIAVVGILLLHLGMYSISFVSISGAIATVLFIYIVSKKGKFSSGRLILVGIGVQAMLNSLISFVISKGNQGDLASAYRWMAGSLNGTNMKMNYLLLISIIITIPFIVIWEKDVKIMELGDESAIALGVNLSISRGIFIILTIVSMAIATATTGPIAFMAFLPGPIAKKLVGYGGISIIESGLVGSIIVLLSQIIGEFAFPIKYPVGIITGLIGAPYLLYLIIVYNKKGGV